MFPKILPVLALAAFLANPAFAQSQPASDAGMAGTDLHHPVTLSEGYRPAPGDHLGSLMIGMSVFSGASDTAELIGAVDDLVVGSDGRVAAAVLNVGGFLGVADKRVAVDYGQLQWSKGPDGADRIVLNASKQSLAAAPDFAWHEDLSAARADVAEQEAENLVPNANDTTNVSPDETTDQPETGHVDSAALQPIDAAALTAEDLKGIAVYGTDDELIGTIGDFVLNADGKVDAVIVDVGGFLGLGKKPVAVGFENLAFSVDADNNRYLFLNASKQTLEAQPAFDKSTYATDRAAQRLVVTP